MKIIVEDKFLSLFTQFNQETHPRKLAVGMQASNEILIIHCSVMRTFNLNNVLENRFLFLTGHRKTGSNFLSEF